jgi:hypothetical protein
MLLDPIGQGIEAKLRDVRDAEHTFGRFQQMSHQDAQFRLLPQIGHREVGHRRHQRHHVLKPNIVQQPDIFQLGLIIGGTPGFFPDLFFRITSFLQACPWLRTISRTPEDFSFTPYAR